MVKPVLANNIPVSPTLVKWAASSSEEAKAKDVSFSEYLRQAIKEVDDLQKQADKAAMGVITGEVTDLHQAVLAAEKAMLSLQLTLQVRNKVLEAYQEIMRMPV